MKRMLCLFLALILAVGICFSAPVTITASAAYDITVTIDTGASVTLKDADGDGYYDIGTADELYAFATAVNGGKKTINVELTADITVNENVLTADGELNGDGSNFRVWTPIGYYNSSDDKSRYSGTFHGNDKTISGLYFNNSNVSYVGLFGTVDYGGKIENVSVIDSYTSGKSNVGGVVGANGGTVTNCYNKGTVSGSSYVGGVVGSSNGGTVTNCYNEGNVSGTGESVGGVVGENSRTVEDCYNKGTVSGSSKVGGVVGYSNSTVRNCYNEGTVSGTGERVGGVVGYSNGGTVTNCYNEGTVSGTGERVGGVVGYSNGGTVTNCYNKGAVSGSSSVGGVVGYSNGTVTNCYNEGTVSGTGENVGGVVGSNRGIVTNCYNKGTVSGSSYVGGVVGYSYGTVKNCYNEGTVSGTGERVGGVVGYNYMTCKNCYYLSDCATDGNNVTQFGIGNITLGSTTADVSGQTDSKTADWFTSGEVCAAVGYHQGADAANGFCDLCTYDPATLNADEYYEISNAGQLFWFADYINTEDRTANAVLTADIDLENRPWTPIGKTDEDSNNFRGHFDGQNHTIKGLYIERSSKGIGFFGEVRTGIVENFTIYGEVNVKGECDYVGGVFGSTCGLSSSNNELERNGAIIRNITSYVNLTAGAHGIGRIGGFVGYANHETLIENCSWYGTFDAGSYRVDTGAGGFIGNVHEGSNVTIRNCAAYGTIKTNYKKNSYDSKDNIYMGGFLSYSESDANTTLENCLFAGKFEKGENLTDQALLGAFGTLKSVNSIVNCYYLGDDGLEAVHSDSALKPGSDNVEITSVTKAQLLSGEVAYKLQGEENTHFWGQTIDTDDYPVLGGDKVYYGYISCADDAEMVYTNNENAVTEKPKHTGGTASCKEKAVCENCGDSYGDLAPHTYISGKCTTEGCGYACAHETKDEKGICTVCYIAEGTCGASTNDGGESSVEWLYDSVSKTLTITGSGAMADYTGYDDTPWYNYQNDITKVVIENGVTTIGSSAFNNCTSLTTIEIPDSVTTIGEYAFFYCKKLTSVTIPDSVTTIGSDAFANCTSLTSVTIGEGVTTIAEDAFEYCTSLTSIEVDENNAYYSSNEDGVLFNKEKTELIYYPLGKDATSYTIPDGVKSIGGIAFYGCTSLESVTIPDSVTTIGVFAFRDCIKLTSVTIPDSVTTIGREAFYGCTALETVTILSSEIVIEANAFYDCTSLTTVKVPCNWDTENPLYAFDENVNVAVAEHKEMIYVDNNDGTHTAKYSCCGTVIGEPEKHSFNESEYCEFCEYQCPHPNYTNGRCDVCKCYCPHTNTEPVYNSYEDNTNQHYKHYECCGADEFAGYHNDENGDTKCDQCKVQLVVKVHLMPATSMGIRNGDNYFTSLENAIEKANEIFDGGDLILLSDAVINSEKALTIDKNKLDTNGKKLTVNGTLVLPDSEYTGATIPTGVVGSGTVKIGENFFKLADNGKWCCAEESQHTSSVQTCVGYLCELCGNYYGEANDNHDIVIDKAVEATCTETGLTEGQHCTRCDDKTVAQEVVPALNHKGTLVQVEAKAPTCEAIGWDAYEHCTECDYTTYKEKAKLGHDKVSHSAKSATCEAIGWYAYDTCSRCDYTTYKEIAKLGHDIVIDKAVAPTCTKTGLTEGSHCSRCNDKTVKQNVIPTKAHTEVTVTGKAATCTETGLTDGKKCSVCGATTVAQQTIAKKGHTEVTVTGKAATCTATGLTDGKKCSVCGAVTVEQQVISATGHTITVVGKKDATTKDAGYTGDKVCSVCNAEIEKGKEIPKIIVSLATPTVTIKNTAKGIEVNWNAIENAESYIVYRSIYNASTKKWSKWAGIKTGVTETSFVDGTVKLGTSYKYTVRAVNGDVKSSYVSTKALKYNVVPTVKIANTATGVKVAWSTAANATGYTVYSSTYNTKTKKWSGWKNRGTAKATATSWVDKNATKSGAYYKYTVRACNGKDIKSSYNKDGVKTLFLATPTVKIANNAKGVKVTWNKITGSKGYIIYRSEINNGKWSNWKNMGTVKNTILSWVDKNAQSGTTYRYTVRAVNGNYKSAYKASGSLIFLSQPTVKVANASNGIKVSWNKVDGVTGYTVYSSTYDAKTKKWSSWKNRGTAKANKTSWVDKNVKSGVKYKYTVRAVNGKTRSTYVSSSALLYLAQPTVTVKAVSNGINVAWSQCEGATGYTVYRSELVNGEWSNWTNMGTAKSDKKSWTDKKAKKGATYKYTVRAVNADTGAKSSYIASKNVKR